MKLCALLTLICLSCLHGALAQSTALPPAQGPAQTTAQDSAQGALSQAPTLSARSTLVLVPALVRNKAGQLVFTLKANDFVLTDDGIPQKLTLEQDTGGEPLALAVVLEGGGAAVREIDKYRALATMIDTVVGGVPHRVAVIGYDSAPVLVEDFTPDTEAVAKAVLALINDNGGDNGAATLAALGFAVDQLRKQPPAYRRAILLVSESNDHGSHIRLEDALRAISDTNTAIFSFGFSSGADELKQGSEKAFSDPDPGPAHGCMSRDPNDPQVDLSRSVAAQAYDCLGVLAPPLALAKAAFIAATEGLKKNIPETVARLTGGEYFKLTSEKVLERDLQTISNHIPNRYVLSFQPVAPHSGFHVIALKLPGFVDLKVSARDGYWADTAAAPAAPATPSPAH
jgi:VWFA-related protein